MLPKLPFLSTVCNPQRADCVFQEQTFILMKSAVIARGTVALRLRK